MTVNTMTSTDQRREPLRNKKSRMYFIDNIKWIVIMLVVLIHTNVTYSGTGFWYYMETGDLGEISTILFGIFGSFTQAFTMGLLFLIAGYFTRKSVIKKTTFSFMKDKIFRLGLPILLYIFVLNPLTNYLVVNSRTSGNINFIKYYADTFKISELIGNTGPLWFALALLIFSILYALAAKILPSIITKRTMILEVNNKMVYILIAVIGLLAFAIRLAQPMGTSIYNMQIGFFAQYIVLFIVGTLAQKYDIFNSLNYEFGKKWLTAGLVFSLPIWLSIILLGDVMVVGEHVLFGGMYWQSFAYALWESFFCVSISVGLITVLREKFNDDSGLNTFLSDNSFSVYVLHAPILVFTSILMKDVMEHPFDQELRVPLPVDVGIGPTWASAKK